MRGRIKVDGNTLVALMSRAYESGSHKGTLGHTIWFANATVLVKSYSTSERLEFEDRSVPGVCSRIIITLQVS